MGLMRLTAVPVLPYPMAQALKHLQNPLSPHLQMIWKAFVLTQSKEGFAHLLSTVRRPIQQVSTTAWRLSLQPPTKTEKSQKTVILSNRLGKCRNHSNAGHTHQRVVSSQVSLSSGGGVWGSCDGCSLNLCSHSSCFFQSSSRHGPLVRMFYLRHLGRYILHVSHKSLEAQEITT